MTNEYRTYNSFYNTGVKLPDSVVIFDNNRTILHMTKSAKRKFGYNLIGADMSAIMNPGEYILLTKLMCTAKRTCGCLELLGYEHPTTAVYTGFTIRGKKLHACVISRCNPVKLRQLVNSSDLDLMNPEKVAKLYDDVFFSASHGYGIDGSELAEFYQACMGLAMVLTRPFMAKPLKHVVEIGNVIALWKMASDNVIPVYYDPLRALRYELYADQTFLVTLFSAINMVIQAGKEPALHIRRESDTMFFEFGAKFPDAPEIFPTKGLTNVDYFDWFPMFFIECLSDICELPVRIACKNGYMTLTISSPCAFSEKSGTFLRSGYDDPVIALYLDYARSFF